jgi:hypothetical protein
MADQKMSDQKRVIFTVEKSTDKKEVVVYEAIRVQNALADPFIDIFWKKTGDSKKHPISVMAIAMFFGFTIRQEKNVYVMSVNALPHRLITVHLKKSGDVVAKTVIDGKESRLERIVINLDGTGLMAESMTVHGVHKHQPVQEVIAVTSSMKSKFISSISSLPNLSSAFRSFFA